VTTDLITKLEKVAESTPADNTTKLTEIKTIVDELKTKGAKADLTDITSKVDALTTTAKEIKDSTSSQGTAPAGTNY
jgi:formiminotetrahydrofolate cyclodeaminase